MTDEPLVSPTPGVDQADFSMASPMAAQEVVPPLLETPEIPEIPEIPESSGGPLPSEVIRAAKDAMDPEEETAAPDVTEAPAETIELTATPAPEEPPEPPASWMDRLASPWLTIALGACALGLLAGNVALLLRRKKRPAPGIRIGRVHAQGARQYQQDCLAVSDPDKMDGRGLLAVVADGMGGLSDGDKLSAAAVEAALGAFIRSTGAEPPEQLLLTLARKAVLAVEQFLGPENLRKGGTTLLLGLVRNGRFYYFSVGDSHIYLLRDGGLVLLNREHIYANELALRSLNGEMTAAQAYGNSQGNGLVSFLGMGAMQYADIPAEPVQIVPGDKFILMSDGVYNALEPEEMRDMLDSGSASQAAARLEQAIAAKAYANQDNYTAVILECGADV